MAELAERHLRGHARLKKKPSSAKDDERNWQLHVLPRIGSYKVVDVSRADIAGLHGELGGPSGRPDTPLNLSTTRRNSMTDNSEKITFGDGGSMYHPERPRVVDQRLPVAAHFLRAIERVAPEAVVAFRNGVYLEHGWSSTFKRGQGLQISEEGFPVAVFTAPPNLPCSSQKLASYTRGHRRRT
jgi:hypothetical protein